MTSHGKLVRPKLYKKYKAAVDRELSLLDLADQKKAILSSASTAADVKTDSASSAGAIAPASAATATSNEREPSAPPPLQRASSRQAVDSAIDVQIRALVLQVLRTDDVKSSTSAVDEKNYMQWQTRSFGQLSRGCPRLAMRFFAAVRELISRSAERHSIVPPLDYVIGAPIQRLVHTIAYELEQGLIAGFSEDSSPNEVDSIRRSSTSADLFAVDGEDAGHRFDTRVLQEVA